MPPHKAVVNGLLSRWLALVGVLGIVLVIFLFAENKAGQSFQQCVVDEGAHQSTNNPNKSRFVIGRSIYRQIVCSVEFLDNHNGFITAIAGIAVAIFTYTLYTVSVEQSRLTRESINLAREEFISTHRPVIVFHSVEVSFDYELEGDDAKIGASIFYFNKGDTDAKIASFYVGIGSDSSHCPVRTSLTAWKPLRRKFHVVMPVRKKTIQAWDGPFTVLVQY